MMTSKVSVIIPIYNIEKYLDRCIESVVKQTYDDLEIILVDDCSQDRSSEICDIWKEKDLRIKVIHNKENVGQGIGRNRALKIATGKYVCFFDGDDYVTHNAIERLVLSMERENADIAVCGMKNINEEGEIISQLIIPCGEKTFTGEEVRQSFLPDYIADNPRKRGQRLFYMSACMAMYSISTLKKLGWEFTSERQIISEDVYSLLELIGDVNVVTVVPDPLYCYCHNGESFSRKYRTNRYREVKNFYLESLMLCKRKGYGLEIQYRIAIPFIHYAISVLKQEAKAANPFEVKKKIIFQILEDDVLMNVISAHCGDRIGFKQRILFFVLNNRWKYIAFMLFMLQK